MIVVYRTPCCTTALFEQMVKAIGDLVSCNHSCIIMGDFNIPGIHWSQHTSYAFDRTARSFLNMCDNYGFTLAILEPTLGRHILDLVLTNDNSLVKRVEVLAPLGTSDHADHASIHLFLNLKKSKCTSVVTKWDLNKANFGEINRYLSDIDWYGSLNTASSVDAKYELSIQILRHTMDLFVPKVVVPTKKFGLPRYIQKIASRKLEAWNKAKLSNEPKDIEDYKRLAITYEKRLRKYYSGVEKKIIESKSKTKFFRYVKARLINKTTPVVLKREDGTMATNDDEKAEIFC